MRFFLSPGFAPRLGSLRTYGPSLFYGCLLLLGAYRVLAADPSLGNTEMPESTGATSQGGAILREGTELVEQAGHFRAAGDRIAFFSADGRGRYIVLENLNLQRIAQVLVDDPTPVEWMVSGFVTEFRGDNYLYVRSAAVGSVVDVQEQNVR